MKMMSDLENLDVMLESYSRNRGYRIQYNVNLISEEFRAVLNANRKECTEITSETA